MTRAVRTAVVAVAMLCAVTTLVSLWQAETVKSFWFLDFGVFWTAGWFPHPYNAVALTRAQLWLLPPNPELRPFAYPPPALILLKPLGLLNYTAALWLWTALGVSAFAGASLAYGRRAILAILSPVVALSIVTGQASLFIGAGLATAVKFLERREILAGILFGIVAAVKPQLAILVPLALIAGRHWSALGAAIVSGAIMVIISLALGPHLWIEWLRSLQAFADQVLATRYRTMNWAPGLWFAPIGAGSVWYVFRFSRAPEVRLVSLVAGTCLCLPYMMNYDLVAMAPAASVLLLKRDPAGWLVGFFALVTLWLSPVIVAVGSALLVLHRLVERLDQPDNILRRAGAEARRI